MAQPRKYINYFESQIRKDEDDCWIWQGPVTDGIPIIITHLGPVDARLFAADVYKVTVPAEFETCSPLDVNPAHIKAKTQITGKYRKQEDEGMGKSIPGGDTPDIGNGISQGEE